MIYYFAQADLNKETVNNELKSCFSYLVKPYSTTIDPTELQRTKIQYFERLKEQGIFMMKPDEGNGALIMSRAAFYRVKLPYSARK